MFPSGPSMTAVRDHTQVDARANINLDPVISRLESARSGGGTANGGEGQEDRRQTHDGRFEWKRSDLGEAGYHM
jgi:hypothetical protein